MAAHGRKNRGFTLMETLIVVGVIVVLAAVSLPLFMDAIEKSRCAADEAYERAAIVKAQSMYAGGKYDPAIYMYEYDPETGNLYDNNTPEAKAIPVYGKCSRHKSGYLWIRIGEDGGVQLLWASDKGSFFDIPNSTVPHHTDKTFPG